MLHEAAGRADPNDSGSATPGATDHAVTSSSADPSATGERFACCVGGAVRFGVLRMFVYTPKPCDRQACVREDRRRIDGRCGVRAGFA